MRDEFGFDQIDSVEFCVSVRAGAEHENFLVPSDVSVQTALRDVLNATVAQLEGTESDGEDVELDRFELSEKYAATEALIADLASEQMTTIHALYDEEGWHPNPGSLRAPANISYYFAVFRDRAERKLLGVRQATQFKGVVKSRLIRFADDSLTMADDRFFKLDTEFDFIVTGQHVYILHPRGFERIAEIEELVSARAREKAIALGTQITFADFTRIAEFVAHHKRAARLVTDITSRGGLDQIQRSKLVIAAREANVGLETIRRKIGPSAGSEISFLELLDARRYTIAIKAGPKEAYLANSRKRLG